MTRGSTAYRFQVLDTFSLSSHQSVIFNALTCECHFLCLLLLRVYLPVLDKPTPLLWVAMNPRSVDAFQVASFQAGPLGLQKADYTSFEPHHAQRITQVLEFVI